MNNVDVAKVRVCVRCRPLTKREIVLEQGKHCISYSSDNTKLYVGDSKEFVFDRVFDEDCDQHIVFDDSIKHLVDGCFQGYNATILAYGQTGSGKTYTMGSGNTSTNNTSTRIGSGTHKSENEGIIPRSMRRIFRLRETDHRDKTINLRISFLEIYNEEIRDLLHPDINSADIAIREGTDGRIFFTGAREETITCMKDVFYLLEQGSAAIFSVSVDVFEYHHTSTTTSGNNSDHHIDNEDDE
eukprot:gene3740-7423_t